MVLAADPAREPGRYRSGSRGRTLLIRAAKSRHSFDWKDSTVQRLKRQEFKHLAGRVIGNLDVLELRVNDPGLNIGLRAYDDIINALNEYPLLATGGGAEFIFRLPNGGENARIVS